MTAISELKQNQVIFPKLGIDITIRYPRLLFLDLKSNGTVF